MGPGGRHSAGAAPEPAPGSGSRARLLPWAQHQAAAVRASPPRRASGALRASALFPFLLGSEGSGEAGTSASGTPGPWGSLPSSACKAPADPGKPHGASHRARSPALPAPRVPACSAAHDRIRQCKMLMVAANTFGRKLCLSLPMEKKCRLLTEDPSVNKFAVVANSCHIQKFRKEI